MRIGSRPAPDTTRAFSRASATPEDFGAGVATAIGSLGRTLTESGFDRIQVDEMVKERERRNRNAQANIDFMRTTGEMDRQRIEARVNAPPGAPDYTNQINEQLDNAFNEFLGRNQLDEEQQARFREQWERYRQGALTSDFTFEIEAQNEELVRQIGELASQAQARVREAPDTFIAEYERIMATATASDLPLTVLAALEESVYSALAGVAAERIATEAATDHRPVRQPGEGAVAPGLTGAEAGFLGALHRVESNIQGVNPYNVLFGGATFSSYDDHPRITRRTANGTPTTAAGRYQFTARTWDFVRRNMEAEGYDFGDQPFSPVNQDRAALWYAAHRYNQIALPRGMRDFNSVMQDGDFAELGQMRTILAGTGNQTAWQGLQHMTNTQFFELVSKGINEGGTGNAEMPNLWRDERFARIPFEDRRRIEASAMQAASAAAQARAHADLSRQQQIFDGLLTMQQNNDPGLLDAVMGALPSLSNVQMRGRALDLASEERAARQNAADVQSAIINNRSLPAGSGEKVDDWLEKSGLAQQVRERSPEAAAAIREAFRTTGQLGPQFTADLVAMSNSANPQDQMYALQLLGFLHEASPHAFRGQRNEEARDAGLLWSQMRRVQPDSARALEQYNFLRTPEGERVRRQRQEEARELSDEITDREVLRNVTNFFERTFGGVRMPAGSAQNIMLHSDYRRAFEEAFVLLQDKKAAHAYAGETIASAYHPDPESGVLMYLSPASPIVGSIVGPMGTDMSWVGESLREQIPEVRDMQGVRLITDSETVQSIMNGEPPSYVVHAMNDQGMVQMMLDDDGAPVRFRLTPTPNQLLRFSQDAILTNIDVGIERMQRELDSIDTDAIERNIEATRELLRTAGPRERAMFERRLEWLEDALEEAGGSRREELEAEIRRRQRERDVVTGVVGDAPQPVRRGRSRREIILEIEQLQLQNLGDPVIQERLEELWAEWRAAE